MTRTPTRRRRAWLAAALVLALTGPVATGVVHPASSASADSVTDRRSALEGQIAQLRDTLEGTSQDLVEASVQLLKTQSQLKDARAALTAAQQQFAHAQAADADMAARLKVATAQQAKAGADLAARAQAEQSTRDTVGRIARSAYMNQGAGALDIVLGAQDPEALTDRVALADTALRLQNGAIARLQVEQADNRAQQARLSAVRAQVAQLKLQSAALVQQMAAAKAHAAAAEASVAALVHQQQQVVAQISAKKAAEQARVSSMEAEQARLAAVLKARAEAELRRQQAAAAARHRSAPTFLGNSATTSGGYLSYPTSYQTVTSPFGYRLHPVLHVYKLHTGTDFGVPCGTPVYAAADGSVVSAGWGGAYGNRVVLDNGIVKGVGLGTTYNHLTSIVVHSGSVKRGQLLAYSGTTGSSTGCHLHFEVLVNGSYVNPMGWL